MKKIRNSMIGLVVLAMLVAACATQQQAVSPMLPAPTDLPTDQTETLPVEEEESMPNTPAWFMLELKDVNSGETFAIHDFSGKVVLIETLATWCSNCLQQQQEVAVVHDHFLGNPDLITIGLDIDPNEDESILSTYTGKHGFDWKYAVASEAIALEISTNYGNQFLNPPSTPILLIDREGNAYPLRFGIKSADELIGEISNLLGE